MAYFLVLLQVMGRQRLDRSGMLQIWNCWSTKWDMPCIDHLPAFALSRLTCVFATGQESEQQRRVVICFDLVAEYKSFLGILFLKLAG